MLIGDILYRFRGDYSNLDKGAVKSSEILGKTGDASDSLRDRFSDLSNTTSQMGAVFQTVFASVVAGSLAVFMKTMALTAARTQVLGTTLLVVGENAGYMGDELSESEKALKKLGITSQVARSTLIRMIQTQLDVSRAEELANAARNLAIASGKNTSATLEILVRGLVTLQTETLRTAGVILNLEEVYKKWGRANKVAYNAMTMRQKGQAVLNAIIEQALALDGAYVMAMGDAGKQLESFKRYTEEASNSFGEFYLPAMLQAVLATRDLLKAYQDLDPEMRRLISTLAVFITGLGVLAAAVIAVLTVGALLKTLVATLALSFTPVIGVIAAVGVAITAFGALWSTNMWGIQTSTSGVWAMVKAEFSAAATTIMNMITSVGLSLKFLYDALNRPWAAGELFFDLQEDLAQLNKEVSDSWKNILVTAKKVARERKTIEDRSNLDLKEGSLKLTEEQVKQREVLRDYGITIGRELVAELKELHGQELLNFVAKEKKKHDVMLSLKKEALAIEMRYLKGLHDIRLKELKQDEGTQKDKLDMRREYGEISEKEAIKTSYALTKTLIEQEITFKEAHLKSLLVLLEKQQKSKKDIELAGLKGTQEIEVLKTKLVQSRLKMELALYGDFAVESEKVDAEILESLRHRHKMEDLENQKAVDSFSMSKSEMLAEQVRRDLEAQDVHIYALNARLASLEEAGRAEGEVYDSLLVDYKEALNTREEAYQAHQNKLLVVTLQEQRKRDAILTQLQNEVELSRFRSTAARRSYELHYATQKEIVEMEKRVQENQIPYEEFYAWRVAKEQETLDNLLEIQMEATRGTDEYIAYRIEKMLEAGATEAEITAEVFVLKKKYATSFAEGWKLGLEEMVVNTYTWADASYSIVQGFADSAANVLDDALFDFFKTGTFDLIGTIEALGQTMLRVVTQALAQMAVQWVINQIAGSTYTATVQAGLAAEQVQVAALIVMYEALLVAKLAAAAVGGGAGAQHGAVIPGYGGGDIVPIMVEPGERIIAKEASRKYFPVLESIAAGTFPTLKGYQEGGVVEGEGPVKEKVVATPTPPARVNVFNVSDPNEVLRILASKSGERVVLNVLNKRGREVRRSLG